jgi:ABC-type phosphate transport system ATPase subunit
MTIDLPDLCCVALIGPCGSGKATFARRFFKPAGMENDVK